MQRMVFLAVGMLALSACQSATQSSRSHTTRQQAASASAALQVLPESALGPQQLAAGECGLFLWSKTDTSKFIFFSKALSGQALMAQGEDQVALEQTGAGGDIFGQFNTRLQFSTRRSDQTVNLVITPGELLDGGQRIETGLLTTIRADGWQTKLPVLGVRACQENR